MKQTLCPCSGETLDRFLRPMALAVLAQAPSGLHGYVIVQELRKTSLFCTTPPNPTGLYRLLREMENETLLTSSWSIAETGPAKRVYELTALGRDCLCRWIETLETYRHTIQETHEFVQQSLLREGKNDNHVSTLNGGCCCP